MCKAYIWLKKYFFHVIAIIILCIILFSSSGQQFWLELSSIATLSIAVLSFFNLREMQIGREDASKPHLILLRPKESYTFRWIPSENLQPIIRPELNEGRSDQYGTRLPVFWLKNIGCGPAKNICIKWSFEDQNIESIINSSEIMQQYNPEIRDQMLHISNNSDNGYALSFSERMSSHKDYCISSPSDDFLEPIIIPHEIEANLEIRLIAMERPQQFGPVKLPSIILNLAYEDTTGKGYKQKCYIDSRLTYLPNDFGSSAIPLDQSHLSPSNLRGHITFFTKEAQLTNR